MATTHLSYGKREHIMRNVGKIIPHTPITTLYNRIDTAFEPFTEKFTELALQQIIKDPAILNPNFKVLGYHHHELFHPFKELHFGIPAIYLPKLEGTNYWGDQHHYRTGEKGFIEIKLKHTLYLPRIHEFNRYGDTIKINPINLEGELLNLFIKFIKTSQPLIAEAQKHNKIRQDLSHILDLFTTTKQLTDTWPDIESFIPPEYLHKSIRQKKAKRVPLTLEQLKRINEINKELLIQKMLTGL